MSYESIAAAVYPLYNYVHNTFKYTLCLFTVY